MSASVSAPFDQKYPTAICSMVERGALLRDIVMLASGLMNPSLPLIL